MELEVIHVGRVEPDQNTYFILTHLDTINGDIEGLEAGE